MSKRNRPKLSADDAVHVASMMGCDDMPDGAYFAMLEEISGRDTCDLVSEMASKPASPSRPIKCNQCSRKFGSPRGLADHVAAKHQEGLTK